MPFDGAPLRRLDRALRIAGVIFGALVFALAVWLGLLIMFLV